MFKGLLFFCKFGWNVDKRYIIYNILHNLLKAVLPLVNIIVPRFIIDELLGFQRINSLIFYISILLTYNFLANSLGSYFSMKSFTLRIKVANSFNLLLHEKLAVTDYENLEDPKFFDLKEKANKFLYGDWHGFSYIFESALSALGKLLTLVGITVIVFTLNSYLLIMLIIFVFIDSFIEYWAKKEELKLSYEQIRVERGLSYFREVFEDFKFGKEIRLNSLTEFLLNYEKKYANECLQYYEKRNTFYIKSRFISTIFTLIQGIVTYCYLVKRVLISTLSIGQFTMYLGATSSFSKSLKTIMESLISIKAYGIYYDSVIEYLNLPNKMRVNSKLKPVSSDYTIEFKNVSYKYSGQSSYALKDINLTIKSGSKISVVGENGAGKTTFIKLLTRLYDPTKGEILLNGVNIKEIDYDYYLSLFSTVFQDYQLLSTSVKENIILSQVSDESKLRCILKDVGLIDKVASLKDGVNTNVYKTFDKNGFEPSGGESQKIAMARALYKNAPIVILDEPTASLDPRAEYKMYQNFNTIVKNKTAIFISHRLSSSKFCDTVALFNKGNLIEYGSHDELIKKNGVYKELFNMQSRYYV